MATTAEDAAAAARNPMLATPPLDSELYKVAAKNLRLNGVNINSEDLAKYFTLARLPCRRLVWLGLITREEVRAYLQDVDWTAVDENVSEGDEDTAAAADVATSLPVATPVAAANAGASGPIRALLLQNGIDLPAKRIAALMHALRTPPRYFVKIGLLPAEAIDNIPKEEDLLNEVHFFRRGLAQGEGPGSAHPCRGGFGMHHHHGHLFAPIGWPDGEAIDAMDLDDHPPRGAPRFGFGPPGFGGPSFGGRGFNTRPGFGGPGFGGPGFGHSDPLAPPHHGPPCAFGGAFGERHGPFEHDHCHGPHGGGRGFSHGVRGGGCGWGPHRHHGDGGCGGRGGGRGWGGRHRDGHKHHHHHDDGGDY